MLILAGDIGGTKTLLGLYETTRHGTREVELGRFASREFAGLEAIVATFLDGRAVAAAAFAIAGPVEAGVCKTTNLPWLIEQERLTRELGAPVTLLNDFAAVVHGIAELPPEGLVVLNAGERDDNGAIAVIGAGTGLGEGIGVPTERGLRVLPSEGGHAHFAPRDELEQRLLAFLRAEVQGRVSVERVISGPGLHSIYRFVVAQSLSPELPSTRERMQREDPSAVIAELGRGADAACTLALSRFVSLYGAEAGDLALTVLPTGGLYIAGGIAPKLIELLRAGDFMQSFLDKGRMSDVLRRIPVAVIMNPHVGLLGARRQACMLLN